MPTETTEKNVKKLKMPKIEVLDQTEKIEATKSVVKSAVQIKAEREEAEYVAPLPINEVAEAIELDVILVPLGTNHRQIRLAFDIRTNRIQPKDIPDIIQIVLKKAAPMIGIKLVEAITVEKTLLDATRQK